MTLAGKWGIFLKKLPPEMNREQLLFAQACYLAGAQAVFQILGAASDATREEAIIIWRELQQEILTAAGRPAQPLVSLPPEKQIII